MCWPPTTTPAASLCCPCSPTAGSAPPPTSRSTPVPGPTPTGRRGRTRTKCCPTTTARTLTPRTSVIVAPYAPAPGLLTPGKPQTTLTAAPPAGVRNYPGGIVVSADGRFV